MGREVISSFSSISFLRNGLCQPEIHTPSPGGPFPTHAGGPNPTSSVSAALASWPPFATASSAPPNCLPLPPQPSEYQVAWASLLSSLPFMKECWGASRPASPNGALPTLPGRSANTSHSRRLGSELPPPPMHSEAQALGLVSIDSNLSRLVSPQCVWLQVSRAQATLPTPAGTPRSPLPALDRHTVTLAASHVMVRALPGPVSSV